MNLILPITAVVPTRERAEVFKTTLTSLSRQNAQPAELIVVDASEGNRTQAVVLDWAANEGAECNVVYQRAVGVGAATQRNQGLTLATQPFVWFFDDDVVFEADCLALLWQAIESDSELGGVNAMITNQQYTTPGRVTRTLYRLLDGQNRVSYAGSCIGPGFNVLPEDDPSHPCVVQVEWLNTTCTIYRRESLPSPPFTAHFTGYSLMEDVALSLTVRRKWKLANARTARLYHDSQPADYKRDKAALAKMELVNRHYVMTKVLGRTTFSDYAKLALLEAFGVITTLFHLSGWKALPASLWGKTTGIGTLLRTRGNGHPQIACQGKSPTSPIEEAHR